MSLLEWWVKNCNFNQLESRIFRSSNKDLYFKVNNKSENQITNDLFSLLPYKQNMNNRFVSTALNATTIINKLFEDYVNDDTLVITTDDEHPSVKANLDKCKNVVKICGNGRLLNNEFSLNELVKKYKNVFVYVIGLSVGGNHFAYQKLFEDIKEMLVNEKIQHCMVIDAVQEFMLIPRDYSIFDYVISTAHALFPDYECGIVISCNKPYMEMNKDVLCNYCQMVAMMMEHKKHLQMFHYVALDYFGEYIQKDPSLVVNFHSPYVFTIMDYKKRLYGVNDIPEGFEGNMENTPMTLRACPCAVFPERMWKRIKITEKILNSSF